MNKFLIALLAFFFSTIMQAEVKLQAIKPQLKYAPVSKPAQTKAMPLQLVQYKKAQFVQEVVNRLMKLGEVQGAGPMQNLISMPCRAMTGGERKKGELIGVYKDPERGTDCDIYFAGNATQKSSILSELNRIVNEIAPKLGFTVKCYKEFETRELKNISAENIVLKYQNPTKAIGAGNYCYVFVSMQQMQSISVSQPRIPFTQSPQLQYIEHGISSAQTGTRVR